MTTTSRPSSRTPTDRLEDDSESPPNGGLSSLVEYTAPMAGWTRKIAFAAAASLLVLGLAEATLQAVGDDAEAVVSPLVYQRNSGSAFTAGSAPGTRGYVSGRRRVVTDKKAGKRILVFGASAAYGEMFSPFTAFSGVAERELRLANPDTPVEVLNLAHGGMGSRQVGEMVFRALENDNPDLVIVYTGNNEYHELRALKARSDRYDPSAELLRRRLSKSALYRFLRERFVPTETMLSPPEGETWLPIGRLDVTVDAEDRELGVQLYREHLRDIALAAEERGVPLVLATVASNLRDHVDRGTPGEPSEAESRALAELRGMSGRVPAARFAAEAGDRLNGIETEGGFHALGTMFLEAGLDEAAADAFQRKELAALRPMTSNRDLRRVVLAASERWEVGVCDLAGSLARTASNGIPGNEEFIDHCHPNARGHEAMGQALATCVGKLGIEGLTGSTLTNTEVSQNPFRIEHYQGHRPIPGFATNPKPADTSTAEGLALAGHQAFVAERYDDALAAYTEAAARPEAPGEVYLSIGLTQLYRRDITGARAALNKAVEQGVPDAQRVLETLSP